MVHPLPRTPATQQGFTLMELMITVAIVGILSTIALNSYSNAVARSKRGNIEAHLQAVAIKQEAVLLDRHAYLTDLTNSALPAFPAELTNDYVVTIATDNAATPPTFTLTATPQNKQATVDARCGTLGLNQAGTKTATGADGADACW